MDPKICRNTTGPGVLGFGDLAEEKVGSASLGEWPNVCMIIGKNFCTINKSLFMINYSQIYHFFRYNISQESI